MNSKEALTLCLENLREAIKREQVDANMYASGASAASLRIEATFLKGTLYGNTSMAVTLGILPPRGPGGLPPIENIMLWLKLKNKSDVNPWAVAKSIAKRGTRMYRNETNPLSFEEIMRDARAELVLNLLKGTKEEILIPIRQAIKK